MRPNREYENDPIYPAASGRVMSIRDDGPFAQIIIEHKMKNGRDVWTVYEHLSGVSVSVGDRVGLHEPLARFMNREELDRYGWQFDHLHFEVLRKRPRPLRPDNTKPSRFYGTYSLECYTQSDLAACYYNPVEFLEARWHPSS